MQTWVDKFKPLMPFGQAPLLRDGDFMLAQSNAILRYLGSKHGLEGDTPQEMANADMINDSVEDLRLLYVHLIYQNYEEGKDAYVKQLPGRLQPFENVLTKWGNKFVLDKVTFVDYNLFDLLDIHLTLAPGCLDNFPTLTKFHATMLARPGIKEYRNTEIFKHRPINYNQKH